MQTIIHILRKLAQILCNHPDHLIMLKHKVKTKTGKTVYLGDACVSCGKMFRPGGSK